MLGTPPYVIWKCLAWATLCLRSVVKQWIYDIIEAAGTPYAASQGTSYVLSCCMFNYPEDEHCPGDRSAGGSHGG